MCSKVKLRKNGNQVQIDLVVGKPIKITDVNGNEITDTFRGHIRMEKWDRYWKKRSTNIHVTPISAFTEGRGKNARQFNINNKSGSPGPAVIFIESKGPNGDLGLFLATQPAIPTVAKHHSRMPALMKDTYKPKFSPPHVQQSLLPVEQPAAAEA